MASPTDTALCESCYCWVLKCDFFRCNIRLVVWHFIMAALVWQWLMQCCVPFVLEDKHLAESRFWKLDCSRPDKAASLAAFLMGSWRLARYCASITVIATLWWLPPVCFPLTPIEVYTQMGLTVWGTVFFYLLYLFFFLDLCRSEGQNRENFLTQWRPPLLETRELHLKQHYETF